MKESFETLYTEHICGGKIRLCNTCNRQFCVKCDANICVAYQSKQIKACCRQALLEYAQTKATEYYQQTKPTKTKTKTEITEITDGKL